jgi:O-methyltransferase involved in polyketide biosynthesis
MFYALQGPMRLAALATGGVTLETLLLQRHLIIDQLLDEAIESGLVGQIVEVACGVSGRGHRLERRHRDKELIYVEGDLPHMAERKRRMLARVPGRSPTHHVVALDALATAGPSTIAARASPLLDPTRGTALVTEGLLSYFARHHVDGMWGRFVELLSRYPGGLYLSDIHLDDELHGRPLIRGFRACLSAFARGQVHLHFRDHEGLRQALREAGFEDVTVHLPRERARQLNLPLGNLGDYVNVVAARLASTPCGAGGARG